MNKLRLFVLSAIALGIFFTACNKDGGPVTQEEVAELIEQTLAAESAGLAYTAEDVVKFYEMLTDTTCGMTGDTSIIITQTVGVNTFAYSGDYDYSLVCDSSMVLDTFKLDMTATGNFDAPRVASSGQASASVDLGNLQTGIYYTLTGNYDRSGTFTAKFGSQETFSYGLFFTIDLQVDKSDYSITGGTASLSVNGTNTSSNSSDSFSYTGDISFTGNGSATLTLEGTNYTITIE